MTIFAISNDALIDFGMFLLQPEAIMTCLTGLFAMSFGDINIAKPIIWSVPIV